MARSTVHRVILDAIAAHPATAPGVLAHLAATALAARRDGGYLPPGPRAVMAALAANPATPDDVTTTILTSCPDFLPEVFARPGTTADQTLAWLAVRADTPALRAALRAAPDPDGTLARHALRTAPGARIYQELLETPTCPAPVRFDAAAALAARAAHTKTDIADIVRVAHQQPARAAALRAAAGSPALAEHLDVVAAARRHGPPARGTDAWFADNATRTSQIVDHLRAVGAHGPWLTALRQRHDPDGVLAGAAVHAAPTLGAAACAALLTHLLVERSAPRHVRHAALAVWASPLADRPSGRVAAAAGDLLTDAPTSTVRAWAPLARTEAEVRSVLAHPGVGSGALQALTRGAHAHHTPGRADLPRRLLDPLLWGVVLATHPDATPQQRAAGLALTAADSTPRPPGPFRGVDDQPTWATTLAGIGQRLNDEPAARVGRDVPVQALTDHTIASIPTVVSLVTAALTDDLAHLGHTDAGHVLTGLAGDFAGTVGDLLTTAGALTR